MNKLPIFALLLAFLANSVFSKNSNYDGYNKFSEKLAQSILAPVSSDNLVFSPQSAYYLLSMFAYGRSQDDQITKQLFKALSLPQPSQISQTYSTLRNIENSLIKYKNVKNITLNINNAIFSGKTLLVPESYEELIKNVYSGYVYSVQRSNWKMHEVINKWINLTTKNKVKGGLNENDVDNNYSIVYANTIYFNGDWLYPFETETVQENFYNIRGISEELEMMKRDNLFIKTGSLFDYNARYVVLPYKNPEYKMVVAWPNKHLNLQKFNKFGYMLSSYGYNKMVEERLEQSVDLIMPAFKVESEIDLTLILKQMNVDVVGSFTKIVQKAYISVNRNGTEAAAASLAVVSRFGPEKLIVNRPFYYAIVSSQGSLFEGRIVHPNQK